MGLGGLNKSGGDFLKKKKNRNGRVMVNPCVRKTCWDKEFDDNDDNINNNDTNKKRNF